MLPTSQMPDRSAWPSGSFGGAGALRFGWPFASRGMPGVCRWTHCAWVTPVSSTRTVMTASAVRCAIVVGPLRYLLARRGEDLLVLRRFGCRGDHLHQIGVGWHQSQRELVARHPRLRIRLQIVNRDGELHRVLVDTVVALLDLHLPAVRIARVVEPRSFIGAVGLHDER